MNTLKPLEKLSLDELKTSVADCLKDLGEVNAQVINSDTLPNCYIFWGSVTFASEVDEGAVVKQVKQKLKTALGEKMLAVMPARDPEKLNLLNFVGNYEHTQDNQTS